MPQLAHVTGPLELAHGVERSGRDPFQRLALPLGKLLHEMLGEQRNVHRPLAQRRQFHGHHVEPEVEVLAKPALTNILHKITIGGGHDAHVDVDGSDTADALELALL